MLIFQKRIYREDLRANRKVTYAFGDNMEGEGMGGQAAEMRGESNAIGVPTKQRPGMADADFFSDDNFFYNRDWIGCMMEILDNHLRNGRTVVLPLDGLGTGLAELEKRAPKTFAYLQERIERLKELG